VKQVAHAVDENAPRLAPTERKGFRLGDRDGA
jgi:hypothetical protein